MTGIMQSLLASLGPLPTFVASNFGSDTDGTLTITKPAGTASGMVLVAVMASSGSGSGTWTGASSWVERADLGSVPNLRIATLVAGGAEPANYTFTYSNATDGISGFIMAFTNAAYDGIGAYGTSTDGTIVTAPSLNLGNRGLLLGIFVKNVVGKTFTTPTGMISLLTDTTVATIYIFSQPVAIGATGTRVADPNEGGDNAGILLGLVTS